MTDKELERVLKALANRRRLAMVKFLKREGEATVGDIAEEVGLSFRATSRHLSVLYGADVLDKEQRGPQIFYRLAKQINPAVKYIITL